MAFEKTKEELEEERRLLAEQYPELVSEGIDPTQANRDSFKRLLGSAFKKDSPLGPATEGLRNAGLPQEPKEEFEMSPDTKKYGYDLFGIKDIAGDVEQEIPFAPKEEVVSEEEPIIPQGKPSTPTEVKAPAPTGVKPSIQRATSNLQQETIKPTVAAEEPDNQDNLKLIEDMQKNQGDIRYAKRLARFRDAAMGAGLGKTIKGDYSMYDELSIAATAPIQKINALQELNNAKAKNDPNSQLSKLIRKSLGELGVNMQGMEKISYAQIEKLYPSVANAMMTKLAAEARKEEAVLTRQIRADANASKEEARREASYEKTRTIVNNKIGKLQEAKTSPFAGYNQAKQTNQLLDNAIEAWDNDDSETKIKKQAAFMQYAKIAQGDDSVVRSSDMQVLAGGLNYSSPYSLLNKFASHAEGSPFTKDELLEMKKVVDAIRKVKKEQLQQRINPIILDAQRGGYDLDQSISPDIIEEVYAPEAKSELEILADRAKRREELLKKQGK